MLERHKSLLRLLAVLSALILILGACGGDDGGETDSTDDAATSEEEADTGEEDAGGGGETVQVTASNFAFEPTEISVPAGAEVTVEFTNEDDAPHTFTASDIGADTGTIDAGASGTATFTAPDAETEFICTIHPDMKGTIVPE